MKFGEAVEVLKEEGIARRQAWPGVDHFIFMVPGNGPQEAGQEFGPYIAINDARGVIHPWTPSASDILGEDWEVATAGSMGVA